ncbi:MAG: AmmeMemoRadiSam system protein B [Gemmataceae bacterium]
MDQVQPRLRPHLVPVQDAKNPDVVALWDKLRLNSSPVWLSKEQTGWLELLDGQRSVENLWEEIWSRRNGRVPKRSDFDELLDQLDQALCLDTPQFRDQVDAPIRPPQCIGCYAGEPTQLRRQLRDFFEGPGGSGRPRATNKNDGQLRAALIPHIDYPRGGRTYAHGFKEVVERTNASLFVIIGTSHYSNHRFTLTRKDFETPLGVVQTDQEYIDKLVEHYGPGLFDDEWLAHIPEHSVELEVVFLQYLYEQRRPIRIVPLVVGPFWDHVMTQSAPQKGDDVGRMIQALRAVEDKISEPICYIISGDLAHIGPKFGDSKWVNRSQLDQSRKLDKELLKHLEKADAHGFFRAVAREQDARRICGLPPTFTALEALQLRQGKVLHYDQYQHPRGHESVSFASVAFYQ